MSSQWEAAVSLLDPKEIEALLPAESASLPSPIPTQFVSSDEFLPGAQTDRQRQVEARIKLLGSELANELARGLSGQFIMDMHTHFLRDDTRLEGFVRGREAVGKAGWNPALADKPQTLDTKVALISGSGSEGPGRTQPALWLRAARSACHTERMDMKTVRWGMIGCGDVTERKSGPGFGKAAHSELVAVMRRNGALAADYARRHGVARWHDDADAIIRAPTSTPSTSPR